MIYNAHCVCVEFLHEAMRSLIAFGDTSLRLKGSPRHDKPIVVLVKRMGALLVKNITLRGRIKGSAISIFRSLGSHVWVVHNGTIIIPSTLDMPKLWPTWLTRLKGKERKQK